MKMRKEILPRILLTTSILLFIFCLGNEGYATERNHEAMSGIYLLLIGWLGIGLGGASWLANPLLFVGWITFFSKNSPVSLVCSFAALAFVISFLFVEKVAVSEAPSYSRVAEYGLGYWLWLSSAATLVLGVVLRLFLSSKNSKKLES